MNTDTSPPPVPPEHDAPLAKRYLDIMMAGMLSGCDPDAQALAVIETFNELYPRRTDARESILFDAHVELMIEAGLAAEEHAKAVLLGRRIATSCIQPSRVTLRRLSQPLVEVNQIDSVYREFRPFAFSISRNSCPAFRQRGNFLMMSKRESVTAP